MSIIGYNLSDKGGRYATGQVVQVQKNSVFTHVALAGEQVFKFSIWNQYNNTGISVELGVYDVTGGWATATLVGTTATLVGTSVLGEWLEEIITPFPLTEGNEYAVAVVPTTVDFGSKASGALTGSTATMAAQTSLPATFTSGGEESYGFAMFAETSTSATEFTDIYTLSLSGVECSSTNFAAGVTVELWPADNSANAETASLVEAVDILTTALPRYLVTTSVAPSNAAGDSIHFIYSAITDGGAGDIKSVSGEISLVSGTYDATLAMVC